MATKQQTKKTTKKSKKKLSPYRQKYNAQHNIKPVKRKKYLKELCLQKIDVY